MRKLILAASLLGAFGFAGAASAIEVTQTVDTTASPSKVWSIIKDFDSISKWHPAAKTSPADMGNKVGSTRVITLNAPGDPTITEQLTARSGHKHMYSYKIVKVDPKVLPVVNYTSTLSVAKSATGSTVTWMGTFDAAPGADDATATKGVTGVYRGGLDNIKVLAEK